MAALSVVGVEVGVGVDVGLEGASASPAVVESTGAVGVFCAAFSVCSAAPGREASAMIFTLGFWLVAGAVGLATSSSRASARSDATCRSVAGAAVLASSAETAFAGSAVGDAVFAVVRAASLGDAASFGDASFCVEPSSVERRSADD